MSRRWRHPGPLGTGILTLPHGDLLFRSAFDSDYGLPRSNLLRVSAPRTVAIELCACQEAPGPDYERVPDDVAKEVCNRIDEERAKKNLPPRGLRHVFVHLAMGPQVVFHQPFLLMPGSPAAELDFTLQGDINLVFREDDKQGIEFTATVQGSGNWFVLDPNRDVPGISQSELEKGNKSLQGQLQLQAAYYFESFKIEGVKLSLALLLQAAGAASYQYDPNKRKAGVQYSATVAGGAGLDIETSKNTSVGLQLTTGPSSGGTVDTTFSATVKVQFDVTDLFNPPKKKK